MGQLLAISQDEEGDNPLVHVSWPPLKKIEEGDKTKGEKADKSKGEEADNCKDFNRWALCFSSGDDSMQSKLENWLFGRSGPTKPITKSVKSVLVSREKYLRRLGIETREKRVTPKALTLWEVENVIGSNSKHGRRLSVISGSSRRSSVISDSPENGDAHICVGLENLENVADVSSDRLMTPRTDDQARMKFLQKLSYEGVWVPKPQRPPSHQTLIIFDWDDTLMCTSHLNYVGMCGLQDLPVQMRHTLQVVEQSAAELLEMALNVGQTFIITNAVSGWVEASARFWAPSLLDVLKKVHVVSARSRFEAQFPDDGKRWKTEAFLEIRRRLDTKVITNLISLGDSECEMQATKAMGEEFQQATIKFVKFKSQPSAEDIVQQLSLVKQAFKEIVGKGRSLAIKLKRR